MDDLVSQPRRQNGVVQIDVSFQPIFGLHPRCLPLGFLRLVVVCPHYLWPCDSTDRGSEYSCCMKNLVRRPSLRGLDFCQLRQVRVS